MATYNQLARTAFSPTDVARGLANRPDLLAKLGWTGGPTFVPGQAAGGESGQITEDTITPEFAKFLQDKGIQGSYSQQGENVTRYLTQNNQLLDTEQGTTGMAHGGMTDWGPKLLTTAIGAYLGGQALGGLGGAGGGAADAAYGSALDSFYAPATGAGAGTAAGVAGTAGAADLASYGSALDSFYAPATEMGAGGASAASGLGSSAVGPGLKAAGTAAAPAAGSAYSLTGSAPTMAGTASSAAAGSSPWSYIVPAATQLLGSYIQGKSASDAAQTNAAYQQAALDLQKRIYEESIARQQPFYQGGLADYNRLRALSTGGPEAAQNFLTMDPGYGFRLGEGLKSLDRQAAARGGLISGGALKAAQRYGQDVASQEFSNAYNRLASLANVGPQAAGVMSNLGQNFAGQATGTYGQMGESAGNALLARGSAYNQGLGAIGQQLGRYYGQPGTGSIGGP